MIYRRKKQVYNPYLPSYEYIPDGEPYIFQDRLYVFGSHDRYGAMSFCENDYVTWSAPVDDLSDWRYEGIIFRKNQDPLNKDGKYPIFAPDVQRGVDGKYYLYYAPGGTKSIGVAVCDTPGGKYQFYGHVSYEDGILLGRKKEDANPFDPGVFLDDDGGVYLYYGFSPMNADMIAVCEEYTDEGKVKEETSLRNCVPGPYAVKLKADMRTIGEGPYAIKIEGCPQKGHEFFEASSMRKINGQYYFIYSSQNSHELCYAIGKEPFGIFRYGGVLHSNGDIGYAERMEQDRVSYTGNNHGSLVEINGNWYIFGHRMTNYTAYSRQGVAERVMIQSDGSISQVEMTSCGLNDGPLDGKGIYEARIACALQAKEGALHYDGGSTGKSGEILRSSHPVFRQDGADREDDPDQHIANMQDGARAGFKYFMLDGTEKISVRTRGSAGAFLISKSPEESYSAKILITECKEWHESETVELSLPKGKQALYFTYQGEGAVDFMSFHLK